ncbi:MAG: tRNA dimethylallyltransferase [candidate division TM6 bacterium GW2011_GWF2_32_72]|nr:MAG: tRNA dimethylallyltransferase [candidate division TM6 bacterium GW2011_GWF2_32_72]
MNKTLLIISGPTGVGKSDLAEKIAAQVGGEIVNADMGQFYEPIGIGTAKPNWKESKIPHHLFDIINQPKNLTVYEYRNLLFNKLNELWEKGRLPILVGGSSFYLKSLFYPPLDIPENESAFCKLEDLDVTWETLNSIDPKRAEDIESNDIYRINRALELWCKTGKKPSELEPEFDVNFPSEFHFIYVLRDRAELYNRINLRTRQMLNEGWIQEVQNILGTSWEDFLNEKKLIGYPDIIDYLTQQKNIANKEDLIEIISKKTRNYAKRQIIFWRMLKSKLGKDLESLQKSGCYLASTLHEVNLTTEPIEGYIEQLLWHLKNR